MTVNCATKAGPFSLNFDNGAISDDLTHWFYRDAGSTPSVITRVDFPSGANPITIQTGLTGGSGGVPALLVGFGGNLYWYEVAGSLVTLYKLSMAGGSRSAIWTHTIADFEVFVSRLWADPVNQRILVGLQDYSGVGIGVPETMLAISPSGVETVVWTRADANTQLLNGMLNNFNVNVVVASDGAIWGFWQNSFMFGVWRWDGSFTFTSDIGFQPKFLAPGLVGVRVQDTAGTTNGVKGMEYPGMTLTALSCGQDFNHDGGATGGGVAFSVVDDYSNIVYWSDGDYVHGGDTGSWVAAPLPVPTSWRLGGVYLYGTATARRMPGLISHFVELWDHTVGQTNVENIPAGGAGNHLYLWVLDQNPEPIITGFGGTLVADMVGATAHGRLYRNIRDGSALTITLAFAGGSDYGVANCFEIPAATVSSVVDTFDATGTTSHSFSSASDGALLFGWTNHSDFTSGYIAPVGMVLPLDDPATSGPFFSTNLYGHKGSGLSTVGVSASSGTLEWVAKIDVGFV